jgi:hypothetical protein
MSCSGNGKGRKRNFNRGLEVKILVLKASSLLSTKLKKEAHWRSLKGVEEGSIKGENKKRKNLCRL